MVSMQTRLTLFQTEMVHCALLTRLILFQTVWCMQRADMVIEAVIEDVPLKQRIFAGEVLLEHCSELYSLLQTLIFVLRAF